MAPEPAAPALEVLDAAVIAAREHKRLGDAVSYAAAGEEATHEQASTHYLAGILELAIAFASVLQGGRQRPVVWRSCCHTVKGSDHLVGCELASYPAEPIVPAPIGPELAAELDESYRGRWVGIVGQKVRAVGDTPAEVESIMRVLGWTDTGSYIIFRVPTNALAAFLGIGQEAGG